MSDEEFAILCNDAEWLHAQMVYTQQINTLQAAVGGTASGKRNPRAAK